jgi:hypothetical protein
MQRCHIGYHATIPILQVISAALNIQALLKSADNLE